MVLLKKLRKRKMNPARRKRILEDSLQERSSKENSSQSQERSSEEDSLQERSSKEGCSQERYSEV